MRHRSTVLPCLRTTLAILLMLVATAAFSADRSADAGRRVVEAPMTIQTEGTTYSEYRANQAAMISRLVGAVPASAMHPSVQIDLSREEIAGVERAPHVSGTPLQIGLVKAVSPRLDVVGLQVGTAVGGPRRGPAAVATPTADGGFAWAVPVVSSGAGAVRVHIESMSLPAGAELYFYSRMGEAFGPYRNAGPNGDGDFWTDTVFGTEGILQLHVPGPGRSSDLGRMAFSVTEVAVIMARFAGGFTPEVGICGDPDCVLDTQCDNSSQGNTLENAVAKMEWSQGQFVYTCTGGLLSDTNPSLSNFFLTANHCLSKSNTAQNVQFYWKFKTPSCNGACPSNTGWPYKTMGATVSATGKKGDFTLLHLNADPPAGSVFLGWTSAPIANTNGAVLHRVSNPDFGPQVYSQHAVDTVVGTCGGWPRGNWIYSRDTIGAIDGGSSGSPIVNTSVQVVGQLSGTCGGAPSDACMSGPGEANATVDGAFAAYFATVQPILAP